MIQFLRVFFLQENTIYDYIKNELYNQLRLTPMVRLPTHASCDISPRFYNW